MKERPIERLSADEQLLIKDIVLEFIAYARRKRKAGRRLSRDKTGDRVQRDRVKDG